MIGRIVQQDCVEFLSAQPDGTVDLIYIDPPFCTGKRRQQTSIKTVADSQGDRVGFGGKTYKTVKGGTLSYRDDQYCPSTVSPNHVIKNGAERDGIRINGSYIEWMEVVLKHANRILTTTGSLFFHIDYREAHYCKVVLDMIFGRESFINEIIWSYDYGGRPKDRWPAKHDTIFWYAKDPRHYTFNYDEIDRIPYMAPSLVGAEKAERGKTPTDCWWNTIVPTNSDERTGYPTQKPLGILERIIRVHSRPGDTVLDFFAGAGTTGEAAAKHGRKFIMVDNNYDAIKTMHERLARFID